MVRFINIKGKKVLVSQEVFDREFPTISCKDVLCDNLELSCKNCLFDRDDIFIPGENLEITESLGEEYIKILINETSEHDGMWAYINKTYNEARQQGVSCADILCTLVNTGDTCGTCPFSSSDLHKTIPLENLTYVVIG